MVVAGHIQVGQREADFRGAFGHVLQGEDRIVHPVGVTRVAQGNVAPFKREPEIVRVYGGRCCASTQDHGSAEKRTERYEVFLFVGEAAPGLHGIMVASGRGYHTSDAHGQGISAGQRFARRVFPLNVAP